MKFIDKEKRLNVKTRRKMKCLYKDLINVNTHRYIFFESTVDR